MNTKKSWGFDTKHLDTKVRPQDDFFRYANGGWMKANKIPEAESRWGSFVELRYKTDFQLRVILKGLENLRRVTPGSAEQIVWDFQRSGMDMKRRNALGLAPLEMYRKKIKAIDSLTTLSSVAAELHRIGYGVLWRDGMDQDSKNAERYIYHFLQGGLGLPDRDYYLKSDPESMRVRTAYEKHAAAVFRLMGRSMKEAEEQAASLLKIETRMAKAFMKKEDAHDPHKTYHKMSPAKLRSLAPAVDWNAYLKATGIADAKAFIVMQPEYFKAVSKMLEEIPLAEWKDYLEWHLVNDSASMLSDKFIKQAFAFYGTVMTGTKKMKPLWRRVLNTVNGNVGELLGIIYVERHFPKEAKQEMNLLVNDLTEAFAARIKSLDWMSPSTKKKALTKLYALNRKIGYPDKWKSYRGLVIRPDDYAGNIIRASEYEHKRMLKKLPGSIDRGEWFMYPQTVNAYFAPNLNDIAFPAAILQPPYFTLYGDAAMNYGCIGAVIGHEITHGFDNDGSKYDHKGNLKSWWTPGDRKQFDAKSEKVRKQFDKYVVADGVKVNGKMTLHENIADLGGLSIAYDALQRSLERSGRLDIQGFTPEQRYFLGFALFERELVRPEFEKMATLSDPHSPGQFRINGPVSNFEPFYEAYGVKKGDKLYRAPKDREMVW